VEIYFAMEKCLLNRDKKEFSEKHPKGMEPGFLKETTPVFAIKKRGWGKPTGTPEGTIGKFWGGKGDVAESPENEEKRGK